MWKVSKVCASCVLHKGCSGQVVGRDTISEQGSTCQAMWIACTHIRDQTEASSKLVGPEWGFFYTLHKGPCELEVAVSWVTHPFPKPNFSLRVTFTLVLTYFKAGGPCSRAAPSPRAQASLLWVDLPQPLMDRCCTHIIAYFCGSQQHHPKGQLGNLWWQLFEFSQ